MSGAKYAVLAAGAALVAALAATPFTNLPVASIAAKAPDVLSILQKRSPEVRQSGALTNKKAAVTMKLPAAVTSAKAPVVPALTGPAAAPAPAPLPVAQAPVAMPSSSVLPAAAPVVLAAVPAPPGGGFVIPPLIIPVGGGDGPSLIVTPPGGGTPPPAVPAIPEPETWAMMIVGFGLLGAFLRRRRRSPGELRLTQLAGAAALQPGTRQQV